MSKLYSPQDLSPKDPNPGDTKAVITPDADFIPMSLPMQKLEVPQIPGYHLHWMRGTPDRIAQALRARYEFVRPDEVALNPTGLADMSTESTEFGDRVSVVAGGEVSGGQPVRLYLMKVKEEYWRMSQKVLDDRSEQTAQAFRRGMIGSEREAPGDHGRRYTKPSNLFFPKRST